MARSSGSTGYESAGHLWPDRRGTALDAKDTKAPSNHEEKTVPIHDRALDNLPLTSPRLFHLLVPGGS
jgi:hypothetical protein